MDRLRAIMRIGLLVFLACSAQAQRAASASPTPPQSLEFQVKAAFLLNFTKFMEWPAPENQSSDSPFTICIAGEDPFGSALDQITQGETVNGRKIAIQKLAGSPAKSCQMIYFNKSESDKELLTNAGPGVLTIGEGEAFIREGGMIAFVLDNRRVRFIINLTAIRNHNLTVSSRLLAVAKAVEK